ncbi:hypothetical protein RSP822_15200 [Ralstonia solanacearum]|nr:hypothetical protein RSP822_15200 [Ralstonia solanacearum]
MRIKHAHNVFSLQALADFDGQACPRPSRWTNGPEFAGKVRLDAWAYESGVTLSFIQPGKPVDNAYIASFNGRFRDECLNERWFISMRHARLLIKEWRIEYNTERPQSSLGYLAPVQFAPGHEQKEFLTSNSTCASY